MEMRIWLALLSDTLLRIFENATNTIKSPDVSCSTSTSHAIRKHMIIIIIMISTLGAWPEFLGPK